MLFFFTSQHLFNLPPCPFGFCVQTGSSYMTWCMSCMLGFTVHEAFFALFLSYSQWRSADESYLCSRNLKGKWRLHFSYHISLFPKLLKVSFSLCVHYVTLWLLLQWNKLFWLTISWPLDCSVPPLPASGRGISSQGNNLSATVK